MATVLTCSRAGYLRHVILCATPSSFIRYALPHNVRRAAVLALALVLSRVPLIRYSFALDSWQGWPHIRKRTK